METIDVGVTMRKSGQERGGVRKSLEVEGTGSGISAHHNTNHLESEVELQY